MSDSKKPIQQPRKSSKGSPKKVRQSANPPSFVLPKPSKPKPKPSKK